MSKKIEMCVWFVLSALCLVGLGHGIDTNMGLGVVGLCTFAAIISMYFGIKILKNIVFIDMPDEVLHQLDRNTGYLVHTKITTSAYGKTNGKTKTVLELTDLATQKGCTANLEGEYPPPGFQEVQMDGNDFLVPWCMKVVSIFVLMEDEEVDYTHGSIV